MGQGEGISAILWAAPGLVPALLSPSPALLFPSPAPLCLPSMRSEAPAGHLRHARVSPSPGSAQILASPRLKEPQIQQFQHQELQRIPPKCAKNLHSCVSASSSALRDREPTLKWILSQRNWDELIAVFVDSTWSCSGTSKLIPKELSSKAAAAPTTFKVKFEGEKKKKKIKLHIRSILLDVGSVEKQDQK